VRNCPIVNSMLYHLPERTTSCRFCVTLAELTRSTLSASCRNHTSRLWVHADHRGGAGVPSSVAEGSVHRQHGHHRYCHSFRCHALSYCCDSCSRQTRQTTASMTCRLGWTPSRSGKSSFHPSAPRRWLNALRACESSPSLPRYTHSLLFRTARARCSDSNLAIGLSTGHERDGLLAALD
jgi:hypothetical protein